MEVEFACIDCGKKYPPNLPRWRCACGGPLEVAPNAVFSRESLAARATTLWRYREAIPIASDTNIISMNEGMTPLVPLDFSGAEILCKLDFLFPTGSFKDRGATVLMSKIKEWGLEQVLMDSSGNAAAAMAAYSARAGIECDIYAPASTSAAKCAQITAYGANLKKIPGPRAASTDRRHGSGQRALLRLTFLEPVVQPRNQDLGVRGVGTTRLRWRRTPSSRLRGTARSSSALI